MLVLYDVRSFALNTSNPRGSSAHHVTDDMAQELVNGQEVQQRPADMNQNTLYLKRLVFVIISSDQSSYDTKSPTGLILAPYYTYPN